MIKDNTVLSEIEKARLREVVIDSSLEFMFKAINFIIQSHLDTEKKKDIDEYLKDLNDSPMTNGVITKKELLLACYDCANERCCYSGEMRTSKACPKFQYDKEFVKIRNHGYAVYRRRY